MKTQQDSQVRMLALENLQAMCKRVSGVCHTFKVSKVTRSRVHVEYSNPDEYGNDRPVVAVFPCWPSDWPGDSDNPRIVLECLRIIGGRDEYDPWQLFLPVLDCPKLWRSPSAPYDWHTEDEIKAQQAELGQEGGTNGKA